MLTWVGGVSGWVGDITCIFFVPMSAIDDSWLSFVPPPVARGRLGYPEGTALGYNRQGAL